MSIHEAIATAVHEAIADATPEEIKEFIADGDGLDLTEKIERIYQVELIKRK